MSLPPVRTILHVDLDAFFAAVEVREDPSLAGKPLVIGADPKGGRGRGVVSTASYEARRFGIHSAMPISQAWRRCPHAIFLPPRHAFYTEVSRRFFAILRRVTNRVEPLSIDEAFLDVTDCHRTHGDGRTIARWIQAHVSEEERLTASIGIAPTKFVAKIASDLRKPNGLVEVCSGEVLAFLEPLPLARLFGAGPKTREKLEGLGIATVGELRRAARASLERVLGPSLAQHLHDLSRGLDPRSVEPDRERKSIGKEHTFDEDVAQRSLVEDCLFALLEDAAASLRRTSLEARTVTVKLRTSDFRTVTRSRTLPASSASAGHWWPHVQELLRVADKSKLPIRLVGVSFSHLAPPQPTLFDDTEPTPATERAERVADEVRRRFGANALKRGRLLRGEGGE